MSHIAARAWLDTARVVNEEEPRAFTLGGTRLAVVAIFDRWIAPEHRYFKVKAEDGRTLVLRHDTASGDWELAGLAGTE